MNATQQIANRFREVILNGTWIANTNFRHQLEGTSWELAITQLENFNTIATLAQHIHYYIAGINNVFAVGTLDIRDQFSFDFPPMASQQMWDDFLEQFWKDAESFATFIENMPESQLNDGFVDPKYGSYSRNIDAMIEHAYYHLGQITLIKKGLAK